MCVLDLFGWLVSGVVIVLQMEKLGKMDLCNSGLIHFEMEDWESKYGRFAEVKDLAEVTFALSTVFGDHSLKIHTHRSLSRDPRCIVSTLCLWSSRVP